MKNPNICIMPIHLVEITPDTLHLKGILCIKEGLAAGLEAEAACFTVQYHGPC